MFRALATTINFDELQKAVTAPNWDGLYESLWGNSAALAVSVIIAIVLVILVFRFIRKTIFRIIILILVAFVVGFFALRVTGDAIEINGFKNGDRECGLTVRKDGSWELDKSCIVSE